jgi:NADP-dependent 3-hydroxy acid dehydrogenase YdfG
MCRSRRRVRAFADEGAKLALVARNAEALNDAADEVRDRGSEALVLPLDVSDAAAVEDGSVTRDRGVGRRFTCLVADGREPSDGLTLRR